MQGCRGAQCAREIRRSACTTQGFDGGHCAGKMRRSACTVQRFRGAQCDREMRRSACIIHRFCGALRGNDDLGMIWRRYCGVFDARRSGCTVRGYCRAVYACQTMRSGCINCAGYCGALYAREIMWSACTRQWNTLRSENTGSGCTGEPVRRTHCARERRWSACTGHGTLRGSDDLEMIWR